MTAILLLLLCPRLVGAAGGQGGEFLRQDSTARGAALGGAFAALTDDASSVRWNPAGLARLAKPEVFATHVALFEDTKYDFVGGGARSARWGGFAAAYVREGSDGYERRAGPNDAAASFGITQSAWLAGWGMALPYVDAGVAFKAVRETIDDRSGAGMGADLGLILGAGRAARLGLRLANALAPTVTLVSEPVRYARTFEVSPAYVLKAGKDWTASLALLLSKTAGDSLAASGGVELQYARMASLRLGGRGSGLSTGFGIRVANTQFDYAAQLGELGVSHMLSFAQRFGHTREELEETIRRGISELTRTEGVRLSRAYLEKADDELARDRVQEALRALEAASLLDPKNEAIKQRILSVSQRWDSTLRARLVERTSALAQQHETQGNMLAARQYWKSVQELDPDNSTARERVDAIERSLSGAERDKLKELAGARTESTIRGELASAQSYLARGRYRLARQEAEKSAGRFADAPELVAFLARVKTELAQFVGDKLAEAEKQAAAGHAAEALKTVEGALREDPGNARLSEKALALRSQLQRALTPEGRKQFERLYYRGVELYLRGDLAGAAAVAEELTGLDPTSEPARTLAEKVEAARKYSK